MHIKTFKGLNNVTDPLRLGMGWLVTADNIVVTDAGAIEKREGYVLVRARTATGASQKERFRRTDDRHRDHRDPLPDELETVVAK